MWRIATLATLTAACYDPATPSCERSCAADTDCAPGHACSAGLCAAPGESEGCSASPTDAAIDAPLSPVGTFALQIVNRDNGCSLPNWTTGGMSTVDVVIAQNGAVVVGEPRGLVATVLDLWLGAHVFAGSMSPAGELALVLAGNKVARQGACEYTFDASFDAQLDGDFLTGALTYRARTNGEPACGALVGCVSRQELAGARAPSR